MPLFRAELRRVSVIMGANGTGKSKLLNYFRGDPREVRESVEDPLRPVVYVEGARVVSPPDPLQLNGSNINEYKSIETARRDTPTGATILSELVSSTRFSS